MTEYGAVRSVPTGSPSAKKVTPPPEELGMKPSASEAVAVRVTAVLVARNALATGAVIATVGGTPTAETTLKLTAEDSKLVAPPPVLAVARAVRVCAPGARPPTK